MLAVVDPHAGLVDGYLAAAEAVGQPIVAVFETHVQADHVSGLPELVGRTGATAYLPAGAGVEFLMAEGLVHRLASRNAFIACPHQHAPQDLVAFLICEGCGSIDEMSSAPLGRALSGLLKAERLEPHLQVLEISGRCAHCRAPAPAEAGA